MDEIVIHRLVLAEASVPVIAGLRLQIDPLVLSMMIAVFFLR